MERRRNAMQVRTRTAQVRAAEVDGVKRIECYFVVFGAVYEIDPTMRETIAPGAFDLSRDTDVRALTDHVTHLVLGRTTAGTLKLEVDERGLKGVIIINEQDTDALNLYARVQRGDVNQCSFGFDILDEERSSPEDGVVLFTVRSVKLYEVSIVTFPAYAETSAEARGARGLADIKNTRLETWREDMKRRLRHGS